LAEKRPKTQEKNRQNKQNKAVGKWGFLGSWSNTRRGRVQGAPKKKQLKAAYIWQMATEWGE
jgi:hypothetical protein